MELAAEIGKRTTNITDDPKETAFLFQQLSVELFKGKTRFLFKVPSLPASPLQSVILNACVLAWLFAGYALK